MLALCQHNTLADYAFYYADIFDAGLNNASDLDIFVVSHMPQTPQCSLNTDSGSITTPSVGGKVAHRAPTGMQVILGQKSIVAGDLDYL